MIVSNEKMLEMLEMKADGATGAFKQVLMGPEQGWKGYVMRLMTLKNMGNSPLHKHAWPHINYVISGGGILYMDGKKYPLETGSFAYVPENIEHQYLSTSLEDFVFLCIVTEEGEK